MILDVCGWVAVIDAAAGVVLAWLIYTIGRRSGRPVSMGRSVGLAVFFGLPAALLYLAVRLYVGLG